LFRVAVLLFVPLRSVHASRSLRAEPKALNFGEHIAFSLLFLGLSVLLFPILAHQSSIFYFII
jgi:hypothetical protein